MDDYSVGVAVGAALTLLISLSVQVLHTSKEEAFYAEAMKLKEVCEYNLPRNLICEPQVTAAPWPNVGGVK